MTDEREMFNDAIKTTTFAAPRISGAVIRASNASKSFKDRSDDLDLAIAFTADLVDRLTELRKRLGWHKCGDAA